MLVPTMAELPVPLTGFVLATVEKRASSPSTLWWWLGALVGACGAAWVIWSLVRSRRAAAGAAGRAPARSDNPTPHTVPASVFVCYRREDSSDVAGRIYDRLSARFGRERVFKDVDAIALGQDFRDQIGIALSSCAVLLAIMGPAWLTATTDDGERRIDQPNDYVRSELDAALARGIPVIPVLVRGARVPPHAALPGNLEPLSYRNGIEVRADPDFDTDMDRLMRSLAGYLEATSEPR